MYKLNVNSISFKFLYHGQTVVSPYVGMAQKQDGSSNGCISNYTIITRLGVSVMHFEALFCPF